MASKLKIHKVKAWAWGLSDGSLVQWAHPRKYRLMMDPMPTDDSGPKAVYIVPRAELDAILKDRR